MADPGEHCVSESDTYEVLKAEFTRLEAEAKRLKLDNGLLTLTCGKKVAQLANADKFIDELNVIIDAGKAELATANAIIELAGDEDAAELIRKAKQLPLTKDKVRVVPGMEVWHLMEGKPTRDWVSHVTVGSVLFASDILLGQRMKTSTKYVYSTPEAAREAVDVSN